MTPLDVRDAEFIDTVVGAVTGMIRAVHHGDNPRLIGELNLLLTAIIEHRDALAEHPHNKALRRAIAALSVNG